MGTVSLVLVVGALGFAVWLILAALKRHDEILTQQNRMLAQLLGYKQPEPPRPPPVTWQGFEVPGQPQTTMPVQPPAVIPMQDPAAFWGQR